MKVKDIDGMKEHIEEFKKRVQLNGI